MTDLLAELRRSPDPADAQLAALLGALRPVRGIGMPRANEPLAAFLAATQTGGDTVLVPLTSGEPDLAVVLAPAPAPTAAGGPGRRSVSASLLGAGLWAKVAVGAALAAAAVAAVVTTAPARDVVVRPAHTPSATATAPVPGSVDETDDEPVPRATQAPAEPATGSSPSARAGHRRPATAGGAGSATPGRDHDARTDNGAGDASDDGATDDGATDDGATDDGAATGDGGGGSSGEAEPRPDGGTEEGSADDATSGGSADDATSGGSAGGTSGED